MGEAFRGFAPPTKNCILCEKEKSHKEFRTPKENEPAIKGEICKACYGWLQLKVKKHGQRAGDTLDIIAWLNILEQSGGYCFYCKVYFGVRLLTIDHIVPITKGGTNEAGNITASCHRCNAIKGNRPLEVAS